MVKVGLCFYFPNFLSVYVGVCSGVSCALSRVRLFATPWAVAHQAPLSMGFPSQEYWSGLPSLLHGVSPTQESNPGFLYCRLILYYLSGKPLLLYFMLFPPPWSLFHSCYIDLLAFLLWVSAIDCYFKGPFLFFLNGNQMLTSCI